MTESQAVTVYENDQIEAQIGSDVVYSPQTSALVAQADAEIRAMCAMAVKFPRDLDKVREKILRECKRPSFAATAMYAKPIGGIKVTGLSVRFAEAAIGAMQHIHVTTRTLAETNEWRKIEARVWDAQNMTSYADESTIEKTIERKSIPKGQQYLKTRVNRQGELLYIIPATEDDLLNKVNSAKSKSIRNSGLRLIPGWLLDECKGMIATTMRNADAADPDTAKRQLFDAFSEHGVTVEQLKRYIGHEAEKLEPAELDDLRKVYVAIRDGETTMKAIMEQREGESGGSPSGDNKETLKGTESLKQRLQAKGNPQTAADNNPSRLITESECKRMLDLAEIRGWKGKPLAEMLKGSYGVTRIQDLTLAQYNDFMRVIQTPQE